MNVLINTLEECLSIVIFASVKLLPTILSQWWWLLLSDTSKWLMERQLVCRKQMPSHPFAVPPSIEPAGHPFIPWPSRSFSVQIQTDQHASPLLFRLKELVSEDLFTSPPRTIDI